MRSPNGPMPVDARLRAWLQAQGSLTARLRAFGDVQVQVLRQGIQPLWPMEQAELQQRCGYVREVVLWVDGRPAVWARSATPLAAIKGPWRALRGLGTRPLAELLFASSHVLRSPLRMHRLPKGGAMQTYVAGQWQALAGCALLKQSAGNAPRWMRSSVFWHTGHPLRVMEAFAPWVCALKQPCI